MVYSETIKMKIKSQDFHDITGNVESIVRESEIEDGICNIFSVGATGAIAINENEPMLLEDFRKVLEKVSGSKEFYQHMENAYSHIRSILVGSSYSVPIKDGKLMLGTWQSIMAVNFDTRDRNREVIITVVGD